MKTHYIQRQRSVPCKDEIENNEDLSVAAVLGVGGQGVGREKLEFEPIGNIWMLHGGSVLFPYSLCVGRLSNNLDLGFSSLIAGHHNHLFFLFFPLNLENKSKSYFWKLTEDTWFKGPLTPLFFPFYPVTSAPTVPGSKSTWQGFEWSLCIQRIHYLIWEVRFSCQFYARYNLELPERWTLDFPVGDHLASGVGVRRCIILSGSSWSSVGNPGWSTGRHLFTVIFWL